MTNIQHNMRAVDDNHTPYERASGEGNIAVKIILQGDSVQIGFDGYGEKTAADGHGHPILLEKVDGVLRLMVWGDINEEEPTHIISLEGTRESKREVE